MIFSYKSPSVTIVEVVGVLSGIRVPANTTSLATMKADIVYIDIFFILERDLEIFCDMCILYSF